VRWERRNFSNRGPQAGADGEEATGGRENAMAARGSARVGIGTRFNARYAGGAEPLSGGAHDSLRPPPAGSPAPRLIRFPVGPAVLWVPSAEHAQWVRGEAFQISAPSISAPDKDDAVPRVRKAVRGRCDGRPAVGPGWNRYSVQRSLRWMSGTDVRWDPQFCSTAPAQDPPVPPPSDFPVGL